MCMGNESTKVCSRRGQYVWCRFVHFAISIFVVYGQTILGCSREVTEHNWTRPHPVWWRSEAVRSMKLIDEFLNESWEV
jgi:hypothetical protein